MVTTGYLTYDYFIQKYFVKDDSPLGKQMIWHHIVGVNMIVMANIGGYNLPGICNLMLIVEMSTIFINFRSLYDKKDFVKLIPQVLQILFFVSFTVLRMVGIPFALYLLFTSSQVTWSHLSIGRKICWAFSIG